METITLLTMSLEFKPSSENYDNYDQHAHLS